MRQKEYDLTQITKYDTSALKDGEQCLASDFASNTNSRVVNIRDSLKSVFRYLYIAAYNITSINSLSCINKEPRSIVVVSGGNLGGAIISIPLIREIRTNWPSANLVVVSNTVHSEDIIRFTKIRADYLVAPTATFLRSFFSGDVKKFRDKIKSYSPDLLISNHNFSLDFLFIPLRVPVRIGSVGEDIYGDKLPWSKYYNIPVSTKAGLNWLDSYSDILNIFKHGSLSSPVIDVNRNLRNDAAVLLDGLGVSAYKDKLIAIQAGVWEKQTFKQWPVESLVNVCEILFNNYDFIPVVFGVSGQEYLVNELKNVIPDHSVIDFVGKTSVGEAASLLTHCSVSIVNDSGLMHLSAAVGTPTVFICGVTDLTWVYGNNNRYRIVKQINIKQCYATNKDLVNICSIPCLSSIMPKTVVESVLELMNL